MRSSFVQIDLNTDDIFSSFSVLFVAKKQGHNFLNGVNNKTWIYRLSLSIFLLFFLSSQLGKFLNMVVLIKKKKSESDMAMMPCSWQSSDLLIECFSMLWERSTLLHEVLWFCTRDVLSQKWPSSNPPSPNTFRNIIIISYCIFLAPRRHAESLLLKKHNKSQECKIANRYIMYFLLCLFFSCLWALCYPFCYCSLWR